MLPIIGGLISSGLVKIGKAMLDKNADKVVDFVKDKTGIDLSGITDIQDLSPEERLKLKELESNFDVEIAKLTVQDRQSARQREIEIAKSGKLNVTQSFLAYIAIIGFFGVIYMLFVRDVSEGIARDALLIMLGTLAKIVGDLYAYYFGSSLGSKNKEDKMAEALKGIK